MYVPHPTGSWIAGPPPMDSGVREGTIGIWNAKGECLRLLEGHTNWVLRFGVSADGRYLVSGSEDRTTRIWNTRKWQTEHVIRPPLRSPPEFFAFSSPKDLAIGHRDGLVTFWDLESGSENGTWSAFGDALSGLIVTPDKRLLATSRSSANLNVYSLMQSEAVATIQLDVGYVEHFAASHDGRTIAYCGNDGKVRTVRFR